MAFGFGPKERSQFTKRLIQLPNPSDLSITLDRDQLHEDWPAMRGAAFGPLLARMESMAFSLRPLSAGPVSEVD